MSLAVPDVGSAVRYAGVGMTEPVKALVTSASERADGKILANLIYVDTTDGQTDVYGQKLIQTSEIEGRESPTEPLDPDELPWWSTE